MAEMNSSSPMGPGSDSMGSTSSGGESGQSQTAGFMGRVRERASAQLTTQKDKATDGIGSVAEAVRQSTRQLREQHHETAASYVEQVADQLERVSRRLHEKDIGDLLEDAQRLARRQPALFVGSAFAVGLLAARFLKSSSDEDSYAGGYRGAGEYTRSGSAHALPSSASDWRRTSAGVGGYAGSSATTGYAGGTSGFGTSGFGSSGESQLPGTGVADEGPTSGATSTEGRTGSSRSPSRGRRGGRETEGL